MADRISTSDSTKGGYASALQRFNEFQMARSDPVFSDLKELHIQEEHLKKLMLDYGLYLAKTDIPYGKKEKVLTPEVKGKYFTKLKDSLKVKFPDHDAWHTESSWFFLLKSDIERGATRTSLLSNEAFDHKTLPFYPAIKDEYVRMKHRDLILHGDERYANDMRSLSCLLMKQATGTPVLKAGPLQQRAWFILSMLAVGRGGEIQFQRYDEWHWDVLFQGIDSTWTEIKTLTQHCMMFGPDKESYLCDYFHAFGCFFSVENGLYRGDAIDKAVHKFVFPDLHGFVSSGVAAKLTTIMRKYVSPAVKEHISSRSIRKGCTTHLSIHPSVSEAELNARGGWASETNSKSYKETTPCLTIPGQNALALWSDIRTPKYPPRLECLGCHLHDKLEEFIGHLFIIDLPAFAPSGPLRPFLRACTATMIMYHFSVVKDYGYQHLVVEKVTHAATQANLCDGAHLNPVEVLRCWSGKIKADFAARNPDLLDPALHGLGACLAQCNANLQKLLEVTGAAKIIAEDQQHSIDHIATTLASVSRTVQQQGTSPQRRRSPGSVATNVSNEDDGVAVAVLQSANDDGLVGKRRCDQAETTPAPKRHSKEPVARAFLQHTSLTDAAGQSSAKTPISGILDFMYRSGLLPARAGKDRLGCINLTHLAEPAKYKAAMELVECVITDNQWNELRTPGRSQRDTLSTASAVQTLCLKKLRAWEEAAGLKAPLKNANKARDQGYYIGIGARIVAYKKHCGITGHLSAALKPAPKSASSYPAALKPTVANPAMAKSGVAKSSAKGAPSRRSGALLEWATSAVMAVTTTEAIEGHETYKV